MGGFEEYTLERHAKKSKLGFDAWMTRTSFGNIAEENCENSKPIEP